VKIHHVTMSVPDPDQTVRFLMGLFGFAVERGDTATTLIVGRSRLTLEAGPAEPDGFYHLAFDIPENVIVPARDLLAAQVPILSASDTWIVSSAPGWDAHSVYFNAPGNLNLELIARHRLPNAIDRPFTLNDLLHISEIGVVVDDTTQATQALQAVGLAPFGEPLETFAPVGDDEGLLIVVKAGRTWFPTQDQRTTGRPLHVRVEGLSGELQIGTSCTITGVESVPAAS
jgi:catechol-2,3-dioxygenase